MYYDIAHQTMDRFVKNLSLRVVDPTEDFFIENERRFTPLRDVFSLFNDWEGFRADIFQFKEPSPWLGIDDHRVGRIKLYYGYPKDRKNSGHYETFRARFSRGFKLDSGLEITPGSSIRMVRFVGEWGNSLIENYSHGLNSKFPPTLVFG